MAGKNFDFQGKFGWEQGWESYFSKIRILENSDLFTNLALNNLVQIFGKDKGKTFEAVKFMVPAIPENDLKRTTKIFFGRIDTFFGNKNKLKKKQVKFGTIFDSTSFFKDPFFTSFFKAGDLPSETVFPAAPEAELYPNRWAPLREQNRQLKQDLQTKEEELTLYKRKAASWKGVHVKSLKLLHMLMPQEGKIPL